MTWLLSLLLSLWLATPVWAIGPGPLQRDHYQCEGDPLLAEVFAGAVDATAIPNTTAGTVPGAYVVLRWRGVSLQLPRTNNAGAPSFTDGRWWWSPLDPDHPEFRQRRASVVSYSCQRSQGL
jgi:hypothetical protein